MEQIHRKININVLVSLIQCKEANKLDARRKKQITFTLVRHQRDFEHRHIYRTREGQQASWQEGPIERTAPCF